MSVDRPTPDSPDPGQVQQAAKTHYILTGFSQTAGIRLYAFEGIGDGCRIDYTVEVDLSLIPNYGIRIQDLPLLCRDLLRNRVESGEISALTFTEQEMRAHAERLAATRVESARRRNANPRPVNANPGAGWRTSR